MESPKDLITKDMTAVTNHMIVKDLNPQFTAYNLVSLTEAVT